jgi:hypothetical protein
VKNPKEKGNEFERKVAKLLSDWSGEKFIRTPMSGAIHNFKDKRVVSDITAPLSLGNWPFSIECKKVEAANWEFSAFIEGTSQTLKEHWQQCCTDADRENMVPMLVFSKNRREIYMMITKKTFDILGVCPDSYFELYYKDSCLAIMRFIEFLNNISVNDVIGKKFF